MLACKIVHHLSLGLRKSDACIEIARDSYQTRIYRGCFGSLDRAPEILWFANEIHLLIQITLFNKRFCKFVNIIDNINCIHEESLGTNGMVLRLNIPLLWIFVKGEVYSLELDVGRGRKLHWNQYGQDGWVTVNWTWTCRLVSWWTHGSHQAVILGLCNWRRLAVHQQQKVLNFKMNQGPNLKTNQGQFWHLETRNIHVWYM